MPDPDEPADLTVGQAAARLGVTTRTLHHWDAIGLARPSRRSAAGYRLYTPDDRERLARVVVYRELGLDLDAIRELLDDRATDVATILRDQRTLLASHIDRLRELDAALARMAEAHERGILLSADEQTATFGPEWDPGWAALARERYGSTPQWQQYAERTAVRTADDWRALSARTNDLDEELAHALARGVQPGSAEADGLAARHRATFSAYFPITREMQVCLGRMYEADPRFREHYERAAPGLASWLRAVIDASARAHGIDPETAAWR